MPRSLRVSVEPMVFKWLRESSGWTVEEVAKRLKTSVEVVEGIEAGERQPTLRQLRELSNAYKRPLASFLLSEPVKEAPLPKDYRMLSDRKDVFDRKTLYQIRRARSLQDIGNELSGNIKYSTESKIIRANLEDDPESLASEYRKILDLTVERQCGYRNPYELFHHLRDRFEDMNIMVFQFSMPVEDARGFALTDRNPNVIVINTKDTIEARLFTLMHEFGHILLGETVIDIPDIRTEPQNRIEQWCNAFSSGFLLPKNVANEIFSSKKSRLTETKILNSLKNRYKVSKAMLLYNMLKLDFITQTEYEDVLDRFKPPIREGEEEGKEQQGGGISQDKRCLSEMGNKFISLVANNYDQDLITYTDALSYLSIKSKNFEKVLVQARK
ncbi:MAG TPA: ImmA/IrrE family metallo-endopeptidase [Euryarchaeota archaeon]|nr:ImmA/IrrE family metallo-endopeptidase [Euryarchaeota archaeon]